MNCTHPVLYDREGSLYCHICGALIAANCAGDKSQGQEEKPAEATKSARKRKAKTQAD